MEDKLQLTVSSDGIATLRMLNGENRFRLSFTKQWHEILNHVESNDAIKALIITGSERYFSLGLDLKHFSTLTSDEVSRTRQEVADLYSRVLHLPVPTIAAINGHAYGAGAFLAIACDFRVMRRDRGWLCWPETTLGMRMRPMSFKLIKQKMSPITQRDAALFAQKLDAEEARAMGLVDVACAHEQLGQEAVKVARAAMEMAGKDRSSLGDYKLLWHTTEPAKETKSNL